ncbi:MAG: hypothetical protein PHN51_10220 [Candidatus Nanopelagicales bacterium]|nr:hypothetical protein [Candidatus Nanopelagicales bacterium]
MPYRNILEKLKALSHWFLISLQWKWYIEEEKYSKCGELRTKTYRYHVLKLRFMWYRIEFNLPTNWIPSENSELHLRIGLQPRTLENAWFSINLNLFNLVKFDLDLGTPKFSIGGLLTYSVRTHCRSKLDLDLYLAWISLSLKTVAPRHKAENYSEYRYGVYYKSEFSTLFARWGSEHRCYYNPITVTHYVGRASFDAFNNVIRVEGQTPFTPKKAKHLGLRYSHRTDKPIHLVTFSTVDVDSTLIENAAAYVDHIYHKPFDGFLARIGDMLPFICYRRVEMSFATGVGGRKLRGKSGCRCVSFQTKDTLEDAVVQFLQKEGVNTPPTFGHTELSQIAHLKESLG